MRHYCIILLSSFFFILYPMEDKKPISSLKKLCINKIVSFFATLNNIEKNRFLKERKLPIELEKTIVKELYFQNIKTLLKPIALQKLNYSISTAALHPARNLLAISIYDKKTTQFSDLFLSNSNIEHFDNPRLLFLNLSTYQYKSILDIQTTKKIKKLEFNQDGSLLLVHADHNIEAYDTKNIYKPALVYKHEALQKIDASTLLAYQIIFSKSNVSYIAQLDNKSWKVNFNNFAIPFQDIITKIIINNNDLIALVANKQLTLWNIKKHSYRRLNIDDNIHTIAFSPDNLFLITPRNNNIFFYSLTPNEDYEIGYQIGKCNFVSQTTLYSQKEFYNVHTENIADKIIHIYAMIFHPIIPYILISSASNQTLSVLNIKTGKKTIIPIDNFLKQENDFISSLQFNAQGNRLIGFTNKEQVIIFPFYSEIYCLENILDGLANEKLTDIFAEIHPEEIWSGAPFIEISPEKETICSLQ
ncbi:MAG: hypothetical protein WDZ41_05565 [Candidatus Babeliales bacterium]